MLALRWPFGPWPLDWTLGLLDVGPVGPLSLSALVVIGTRHCWRGMVREATPSTGDDPTPDPMYSPDETSGSCTKFRASWLSNRTQQFFGGVRFHIELALFLSLPIVLRYMAP